jgi:hypothetical protein
MPGTYPPAAPTLTGDVLNVHFMLQEPAYIRRRLRTLAELRFVSDQVLTGRARTEGGAVLFEQNESITLPRTVRAVSPGSEYPRDVPGIPTPGLAAVQKWGLATRITFEKVRRDRFPGDVIDRALRKALNSVIAQVDAVTIAAVASEVTATHAAIAPWDGATAKIWRDVALAAAQIKGLNQGYRPDTLLMSDTKAALMASDDIIAQLRRRETSDNPIYSGELDMVGPYKILSTIEQNLPSDDVFLLDSTQLGSMADEIGVDPGYAVAEQAVQIKTILLDNKDAWDLQARRLTVPVVQETGAAIRITGTSGS